MTLGKQKRPLAKAATEGTSPSTTPNSISIASEERNAPALDSNVQDQFGVARTLLRRAIAKARSGPGQRHATGNWLASQLIIQRFSEEYAWAVMWEYQREVEHDDPSDPYTKEEAIEQLRHRYKTEPDGEPWLDLTPEKEKMPVVAIDESMRNDSGNAERLRRLHGQDMRFSPAHGYLVWDGRRWKPDEYAAIRRAKTVQLTIFEEAAQLAEEFRRGLQQFATQSGNAARIDGMLKMAKDLLVIEPAMLDSNPWLINCLNGTVNLRTGKLQKHNRADFITKLIPIDYNPDAECRVWLRCLKTWHPDLEVRAYLRRLSGSFLVGLNRDEVFPIFWGTGQNGKSKFLNAIRGAMGEYATKAPPGLLIQKRSEQHPTELADLRGARLVVSAESGRGAALNLERMKEMTGEQQMKGRLMRQDFFEFPITWTTVLMTNEKPIIKSSNFAEWRRIQLLEWAATIPPDERDPKLDEKLKDEYEGILAGLVRGCLEWQEQGLAPPPAVVAATDEYRSESDVFGQFLADCTEPGRRTSQGDVYGTYENWAKLDGFAHPMTKNSMTAALKERGYDSKSTNGVRYYLGLMLRDDAEAVKLMRLKRSTHS